MTSPPSAQVAYIWSRELQRVADELPANVGRSSIVHDLVRALGLLDGGDGPDAGEGGGRAGLSAEGFNPVSATGKNEPVAGESERHVAQARGVVVLAPEETLGTPDNLKRYHDADYVDYLLRPRNRGGEDDEYHKNPDDSSGSGSDDLHYSLRDGRARKRLKSSTHGLEHDCPPFPSLARYASLVAAGTVTACRFLINSTRTASACPDGPTPTPPAPAAPVAVHLDGGRHHAARARASGFCYVADAVLGIMHLARAGQGRGGCRPRVMYLDLDLHYGDGVAQAFHSGVRFDDAARGADVDEDESANGVGAQSKRKSKGAAKKRAPQVLTLSVHHSSPVFFPPTTPLSTLPAPDTASPFSLSIPLRAYASPATYYAVWPSVERVRAAFDPDYVVLQLGADGLPADHIGRFGAWHTEREGGMRWCVQQVRAWGLPLCVMGGGGYDHANTARAWALVLSDLVDRPLDATMDVPDHEHYPHYAPSYTLEVAESTAADENPEAYMQEIDDTFKAIAERIKRIVA
ncbi:hypothetical protein Q5752_003740 [Cryptotrichosporon argae]